MIGVRPNSPLPVLTAGKDFEKAGKDFEKKARDILNRPSSEKGRDGLRGGKRAAS